MNTQKILVALFLFITLNAGAQTTRGYYLKNGVKIPYQFQPLIFQRATGSYADTSGNMSNRYGYRDFKSKFQKIADSALIIAAAILNSQEFRDSIAKYTFPCKNYDNKCSSKCGDCDRGIISTKDILDSLYRTTRGALKLIMHNDGKCNGSGSFGYSYEGKFEINSHYITVQCDDTLSFAYKYGYHIAHEYMHIVGFYHYLPPERRIRYKDIAEATGWIAYYIVKRWKENNIPIAGLTLAK